MSRSRDEVAARLRAHLQDAVYWEVRVAEFNEQSALEKMRSARDRANEMAWVLEGFPDPNDLTLLVDGPYAGSKVKLSHTPPRIEVGGVVYTRIDDPDTGEGLGAYAREVPDELV